MQKVICFGMVFLALWATQSFADTQDSQTDEFVDTSTVINDDPSGEQQVSDEELAEEEYRIMKVDKMVVHVGGRFIEVIQNFENGGAMVKNYPAGTAAKGKNTESLPFGATAKVTLIVFNPWYYPTKDTREEYFKKTWQANEESFSSRQRQSFGVCEDVSLI